MNKKCSNLQLSLCNLCLTENGEYSQSIMSSYIINSSTIFNISNTPKYKYLKLSLTNPIQCLSKNTYRLSKELPELSINKSYVAKFISALHEQFKGIFNDDEIYKQLSGYINESLINTVFSQTFVDDTIIYISRSNINYNCKLYKNLTELIDYLAAEAFFANLLLNIENYLNQKSVQFKQLCIHNGVFQTSNKSNSNTNNSSEFTTHFKLNTYIIVIIVLFSIAAVAGLIFFIYEYIKLTKKRKY